MTYLGSARWTSGSPAITLTFYYEKYRSGADMVYRAQINVSTISGASSFGYPIYTNIYIGGSLVASVTLKNASPSQWTTALSYTTAWKTVANKTSGTTAVSFRTYSGSGSSRDQTNTYSMEIDPAMSTVAATDANIGSTSTITITRANDSFTHTLRYRFTGQSSYTDILTQSTVTSYGWTVPTSAYALIPSAQSIGCTIQCETYSGSTSIGTSEATITCYVPSTSAPTVTGTVQDTNSTTVALTGDASRIVRYASTAQAVISATAKNSASIATETVNGTTATSHTVTITNAETGTYIFKAVDSRGLATSVTVTKTLVAYVPLTISARLKRTSPTSGVVAASITGNCWAGSFDSAGSNPNTLAVQFRYREQGSSTWSSWASITVTRSGSTYYTGTAGEFISIGSSFDYTKVYEFEVKATDLLQSKTVTTSVAKGIPLFDWGETDFAFHEDVNMGKDLDVAGDSTFEGDTTFEGAASFGGALTLSTPLPIASGGTGAATAAAARTALEATPYIDSSNLIFSNSQSGSWTYTYTATQDCVCIWRGGVQANSSFGISFYVNGVGVVSLTGFGAMSTQFYFIPFYIKAGDTCGISITNNYGNNLSVYGVK